jgi:hypothetical protein
MPEAGRAMEQMAEGLGYGRKGYTQVAENRKSGSGESYEA